LEGATLLPAGKGNLKSTGLTQNLGQLYKGSDRDLQPNCWVNLQNLSQPCGFYLRGVRCSSKQLSVPEAGRGEESLMAPKVVASSLCTTAQPLDARFANIFGASNNLKRQCDRTLPEGPRHHGGPAAGEPPVPPPFPPPSPPPHPHTPRTRSRERGGGPQPGAARHRPLSPTAAGPASDDQQAACGRLCTPGKYGFIRALDTESEFL
jgi:hypothetical protein